MQLQLHYTNYTTPRLNYNSTTLYTTTATTTITTALHHTTSSSCGEVTTATIATQKTELQPPFGPSVDSLCHPWVTTTNPSYRFPIFETSATALCGTTGIYLNSNLYIRKHRRKFRSQNFRQESERRRAEKTTRRSEKRKSEKKEDAGARKGSQVAKHRVFPMIFGSGGSKSRLATAAGAEPCGQMRGEKLHTVVVRSTFPS